MCIGIPMQVLSVDDFHAVCLDGTQRIQVDTTLVGRPEIGSWLLVFLGAAREILDPDSAMAMRDAVQAVGQIMAGDSQIDHLFDDLIDRAPQLPEHLAHLVKEA